MLLAVGALVLVVSLSYAEGAAAMPEPGGAATFVRRAFSDPAGFVTGWLLFLDYFVVIALAALFVPHYLGAALEWDSARDRPWDAIIAVGVIVAIAAVRRLRRVRLYKVAVGMVAAALVVQVAVAIIGFAVVTSVDALREGTDLGTAPSWSSIALALALATLAYTGIESVSSYAAEAREPGRTLPRSLFVGIGIAVAVNVAVAVVGVSAFPAQPDPGAPDGVANGLGTTWLKAPLVGIASVLDDEIGGGDSLEIIVGITGALILVAAIITAMVGLGAAGRVDGPLRHAAPRLRPPGARRAHAVRRRRGGGGDRLGADRAGDHRGQRRALPRRPLQLRRADRADRRPGRRAAAAPARARPRAPVPRAPHRAWCAASRCRCPRWSAPS